MSTAPNAVAAVDVGNFTQAPIYTSAPAGQNDNFTNPIPNEQTTINRTKNDDYFVSSNRSTDSASSSRTINNTHHHNHRLQLTA